MSAKPTWNYPSTNADPTQTYANDPPGIAALAVYEPTSGCERLLATTLADAGLPTRRVHPNKG